MKTSNIFKAAHKLTKATVQTGDSYSATFAICLKVIYAESKDSNITNTLLAIGLKVWEKGSMKRIYMTCNQLNQVTNKGFSLNDSKNKIFYDFETNAIMRSYKSKKATIEVQF